MGGCPGHVGFERDAHVDQLVEDLHRLVGANRRLEHGRVEQIPLVGEVIVVPRPCRARARPFSSSAFIASRTTERLTSNERQSGLGRKQAARGIGARDDPVDQDADHDDA